MTAPQLPATPPPHAPLTRLLFLALCAVGALRSCAAPRPEPPATVAIPAQSAPAPDPATARSQEGSSVTQALVGETGVRMHRLGSVLLVSAFEHADADNRGLVFWIAQGARLVPLPELSLPWEPNGALTTIAGEWPDRVYALVRGHPSDGSHTRVLQRAASGWTPVDTSGQIHSVAWTGTALIGAGRLPGTSTEILRLLVGAGPIPALPAGVGPQCDAFYSRRSMFDKLAVHAQTIGSVGGDLFAFGMGCHGRLAVAQWRRGKPEAEVSQLDEPQYWDAFGGQVLGRPGRAWYLRGPLRPQAQALLLRLGDRGWTKVALPLEDPDLTGADVCSNGTLWAVLQETLYRLEGDAWSRRDLSPTCSAQAAACLDDGSLWVICEGSVLRLSSA